MKNIKEGKPSLDTESIKKLESQKYVFRSPENAMDSDERVTYEYFEDSVIRKRASVKFGKDETGKDTATISMVNPETKKKEDTYYTTNESEIESLRRISEGKTLVIEGEE